MQDNKCSHAYKLITLAIKYKVGCSARFAALFVSGLLVSVCQRQKSNNDCFMQLLKCFDWLYAMNFKLVYPQTLGAIMNQKI